MTTQLWLWVQNCSCACGNRWTHSYTTGVHGGSWHEGNGIRYYSMDQRSFQVCFRCMPVGTPSIQQHYEATRNAPRVSAPKPGAKPPASDEDLMI